MYLINAYCSLRLNRHDKYCNSSNLTLQIYVLLNISGDFRDYHCGKTTLLRNITWIHIFPFGRTDYYPCYCSLRATYSSASNIDITIESNHYNIDKYQELDIRILRPNGDGDYSTPGEIRITNVNPVDMMDLPARIRTSHGKIVLSFYQ